MFSEFLDPIASMVGIPSSLLWTVLLGVMLVATGTWAYLATQSLFFVVLSGVAIVVVGSFLGIVPLWITIMVSLLFILMVFWQLRGPEFGERGGEDNKQKKAKLTLFGISLKKK